MVKRYRIEITPWAKSAIRQEAAFIHRDSGYASRAEAWVAHLLERIYTLETFPNRCSLAEEQVYRDFVIRKLNFHNHLVLFTVNEMNQIVIVIGCRHGSRKPRPDDLPINPPQA